MYGVSKYMSLVIPLLRDRPLGQLRSIMVLFWSESCLSLTMRGETCMEKGGWVKRPSIALCVPPVNIVLHEFCMADA